jgi:glutathione S-transferase
MPKRTSFLLRRVARAIAKTAQTICLEPQIQRQLDLIESELGRSAWFAGSEIFGADVMMSFPVEAAAQRSGLGGRSKLKSWLQSIHARPAYRAALAKGGPYAFS